jgi:sec-independent protein translocase protein TatA
LIGMPGVWEWCMIIAAVLLFFGASKLPKLGKGLGEGILNFKKGLGGQAEDDTALVTVPDSGQKLSKETDPA